MNWTQLAYQYVIGGLFFFVTLLFCSRPGAFDFKVPSDRKTLIFLVAGLAGYFLLHTIWILAASR